jgi:hypothetical protein
VALLLVVMAVLALLLLFLGQLQHTLAAEAVE